jgi:hypothetical protein
MKPFRGAPEAFKWLREHHAAGRCTVLLNRSDSPWEARYSRRYKEWTLWATERDWADVLPIEAIHEHNGTWYYSRHRESRMTGA